MGHYPRCNPWRFSQEYRVGEASAWSRASCATVKILPGAVWALRLPPRASSLPAMERHQILTTNPPIQQRGDRGTPIFISAQIQTTLPSVPTVILMAPIHPCRLHRLRPHRALHRGVTTIHYAIPRRTERRTPRTRMIHIRQTQLPSSIPTATSATA